MFEVLTDDTMAPCAGPGHGALPDDEAHGRAGGPL
jgi:hypothetical protein